MSAIVRGLRPDEMAALIDLEVRSYAEYKRGNTPENLARLFAASPGFDHSSCRVVEADGRLAGALLIFDRRMTLAGQTLRVGAIAGVCVDPACRRRGYCALLLADATAFMERNGFDVSLLFGEPAVYGGSGWQTLVASAMSTNLPVPVVAGFSVRRADPDRDAEALQRLYDPFNAPLTGPFVRSPDYWKRWIGYKLERQPELRLWLVDGKRGPVGYFVNRDGDAGTVREMAWVRRNEEALPGLLSAIAGQAGDARLTFLFCLADLREAVLENLQALSLADLRRQGYDLQITAHYSGLFKLICPFVGPEGECRDTAALLRLLRQRENVFWWDLDSF